MIFRLGFAYETFGFSTLLSPCGRSNIQEREHHVNTDVISRELDVIAMLTHSVADDQCDNKYVQLLNE
jgi:hypothetical protein